jgi:hypothetical protein
MKTQLKNLGWQIPCDFCFSTTLFYIEIKFVEKFTRRGISVPLLEFSLLPLSIYQNLVEFLRQEPTHPKTRTNIIFIARHYYLPLD